MARNMDSCDSDELDGDLNLSDNEDEARNFRSMNKQKARVQPVRHYR